MLAGLLSRVCLERSQVIGPELNPNEVEQLMQTAENMTGDLDETDLPVKEMTVYNIKKIDDQIGDNLQIITKTN